METDNPKPNNELKIKLFLYFKNNISAFDCVEWDSNSLKVISKVIRI